MSKCYSWLYTEYQPMWYEGHPYGVDIIHSARHSRWNGVLWLIMLLCGILFVSGILTMKALKKWGRKIFKIASSSTNNLKLFTLFKIIGWIYTLFIIGISTGLSGQAIYFLSTHEEYYPEYFLPESVMGLGFCVAMVIFFLCQYPLIYSTVTNYKSRRQKRCLRKHLCKNLIANHLSAIGWAGPFYGIQALTVLLVHMGVFFFDRPLQMVIMAVSMLLFPVTLLSILQELLLMVRHPRNCCFCKNHMKIFFFIAVTLMYAGLGGFILTVARHYQDLSPLLDSTKLFQYLMSSAIVALLGYLGKQKFARLCNEIKGDDSVSHILDDVNA